MLWRRCLPALWGRCLPAFKLLPARRLTHVWARPAPYVWSKGLVCSSRQQQQWSSNGAAAAARRLLATAWLQMLHAVVKNTRRNLGSSLCMMNGSLFQCDVQLCLAIVLVCCRTLCTQGENATCRCGACRCVNQAGSRCCRFYVPFVTELAHMQHEGATARQRLHTTCCWWRGWGTVQALPVTTGS